MTTYKVRYTEDPWDEMWTLVEAESQEEALNTALDELVRREAEFWEAPIEEERAACVAECNDHHYEVSVATEDDMEKNILEILTKPEHEVFDFAHETEVLVGA